jgi:mono/diheme cytochrome c family protein
VLAVAALAPCIGDTPAAAQAQLVERGRAIAERLCARCHDVTLTRDSPVVEAPPFRVLPQRYPVENLAEALAEGIVTGHPAMPQFRFAPSEIDALLSFIDSLAPVGAPRATKRK